MFTLNVAIGAGVGFVIGAFMPAIGRKIKSWFSKEATTIKTDITNKL